MDKQEFKTILEKNDIDVDIVCFNDNVKDDIFCVRDVYDKVEVFYRERGEEFDLKKFESLSEALEYLSKKILEISGKL